MAVIHTGAQGNTNWFDKRGKKGYCLSHVTGKINVLFAWLISLAESTVVVKEKYCSLAEKVQLISQANRAKVQQGKNISKSFMLPFLSAQGHQTRNSVFLSSVTSLVFFMNVTTYPFGREAWSYLYCR